ncbi:MAG: hypothetical protein O3A00_18525 [Planctomycetota bacterium]|nr:hypothetical protein [Planctomycetota bacterium]
MSKNVFEYVVRPNEGIGPIRFGLSRDEGATAMGRFRPKSEKNSYRLTADHFHGWAFQVIYLGRQKTVHALFACDSGDVFGRTELRPRYLTAKGSNLFGRGPNQILKRIAKDAECDPFVPGQPGAYCSLELGLVLYYADFADSRFSSLLLATPEYLSKYPPEFRVASQPEK